MAGMSGDILFLAHRIPFPPDRGDKIRSHHLLKALAKLAPVHVGCFAEREADFAHEHELQSLAASHCMPLRSKSMARAGLEALASGKPVSLTAFDSAELRDWVERTVTEQNIDTIVVFSGQMGQFIPNGFTGRVVIDLCDVDSAKFEAYAEDGRFPRSWIDSREGRLLAAIEESLAAAADHTLLVSEAEAQLFRTRIGARQDVSISALRNGIDADFFDPQATEPHSELVKSAGPHFLFTGQMDYAPNVAGCKRVIERLLPAIRAKLPQAQFHIVGRAPVAGLIAQDGKDGVRVWGEVPDIRPFLAGADIVLTPLEIARGIQNKVLEAMAMARPVLLTPEAATGIDVVDGEHFALAQSDEDLIDRAVSMIANRSGTLAMAAAARRYVVENQSWPAMLAPLAGIVGYLLADPNEAAEPSARDCKDAA